MERRQVARLKKVKAERDPKKLQQTLQRLTSAAEAGAYLMPLILDAVRASATVGEISDVFRKVYGEYRESVSF